MSYSLISTAAEAQQAIRQVAAQRYTAAANRDSERAMYQRALAQALKGTAPESSRSLVVARCDENVDWLASIKVSNIFVYNKGTRAVPGLGQNIQLPNVGREAHTYFHHIVQNYANLSEVTFFLQGWPFDRSSCVLDGVNNLSNFHFIEFGSEILETGPVQEPLRTFWWEVFGTPCPTTPWAFRANSQFGVSRRCIEQLPPEFYFACMRACEMGLPNVPVESMPYLFEQIWGRIFAW